MYIDLATNTLYVSKERYESTLKLLAEKIPYDIKIVEKIGLGNVVWVEEKQRFEPIKKD